ncbi:MAG: hypothetical protein V2B14_01655 [bacterium]
MIQNNLSELTEQEFIKFLNKEGILVKTNTKARGNLGICFKNRIDISKKAAKERRLAILAHEYAHKIHYDLEKEIFQKGGSIEKLFKTNEIDKFQEELLNITNFIDENSKFSKFYSRKLEINTEIKNLEKIIKQDYPDFKKSQIFKPIDSYFRKNKSPAKYLLKYDNIKIKNLFFKENSYSIKNLDKDFSEIPQSLRAYIKLKSLQREYTRLYRLKNKREKYYKKPTELFARFIEALFTDLDETKRLAPTVYIKFIELLNQGYYGNLKNLISLKNLCV